MTVDEYIVLFFDAKTKLEELVRASLPTETEVESRFIATEQLNETSWIGAMRNDSSQEIRRCMISFKLIDKDREDRTAAKGHFKPEYIATVDLFHGYHEGTDTSNTETEFLKDVLRLQYAFSKNKGFHERARIKDFNFPIGIRPSTIQSMHYCRGEVKYTLELVSYE